MSAQTDYQHLAEFRYQIRRFLHFSADVARTATVEPQQHQLMLAVKGAADGTVTSIQYLAHRLFIQHNSAVELVNRSVKKGLVERRQDPSDLRRVAVRLTPKGEKILRSLSQHHRAELVHAGTELLNSLRPLLRGTGVRSETSSRRITRRVARRVNRSPRPKGSVV
jgi:DNA-binding MarR family transcriptional regulator